uniref:Uncharacterized protein AlNc14C168G7936 n=1 Tax=Albugo laibachii Nc14 TaxID=890382 RepID=F0WNA4_9STRA|nr:conserved hypothetical protein [Albugo laibachii Nc14]|eukprot:CCA22793.1 conserved hypothetical protein [Albugo laibachii Nc14]
MLRSLRNHTQSGSPNSDRQQLAQCAGTGKASEEYKNSVEHFLWGSDWQGSTRVETIQKHAEKAIKSVNDEDPRKAYYLSKEIDGVRLYERIPSTDDEIFADGNACLEGQAYASNRERDSPEPSILRAYEKEFRGSTRIPGSIQTVVEILSASDVREQHWISMHTIKGLSATNLCGHSRLNKDPLESLPRINVKYLAARFSKHTKDIFEVCFAEYASYDTPEEVVSLPMKSLLGSRQTLSHLKREGAESSTSFGESDKTISNASSVENSPASSAYHTQDGERSRGKSQALLLDELVSSPLAGSGHSIHVASRPKPLRKAYVYRRSVDERHLHLQDVRPRIVTRKKSNSQQSSLMYYIRDWLYKIEQTSNANVCKVVLTCRVYIPKIRSISTELLGLEFIDFFAHQMASLRVVLSKQWKEQIREAGLNPFFSKASILRNHFRRKSTGACKSQICAICLTSFSMLRRKMRCITCTSFICPKCCVRKSSAMPLVRNDPCVNTMRFNSADRITVFRQNYAPNNFSYLDDGSALENKHVYGSSSRGTFRECVLCDLFGPSGASDGMSRISSSVRMQFTPRLTQTGDLQESSRTSAKYCSRDSCKSQEISARGSSRSTSYPVPEALQRHDYDSLQRERTKTMGDLVVGIDAASPAGSKDGSLRPTQPSSGIVLLAEKEAAILKTSATVKRQIRAQSEDWKYSSAHHKYAEKDLANFNLKLL